MKVNHHKKANLSIYLMLLMVLLLWISAGITAGKIQNSKPESWTSPQLLYLPETKLLKVLSLGYNQFLASNMWVNSVLYFSTAFLEGKSYPWLGKMLLNIQTLDPKFSAVYHYGAPMLGEDEQSRKLSSEIFLKGVEEFPQDFRLRLYAAMALISSDSNYAEAARILAPVMDNPNAPQYMKDLGFTLIEKKFEPGSSLEFLLEEYANSQSPIYREKLFQRICSLGSLDNRAEQAVRLLLESLEQDKNIQKTVEKMVFLVVFNRNSLEAQKILEKLTAPGLK